MIPNHAWLNPSKSQLTFTQEQQDILDSTEPAILVNAVAGSGKTSVLMEMAKKYSNGLYLAFNKAIVTDVLDKLPNGWSCKTFNSFGLRLIYENAKDITVDFNKYKKMYGEEPSVRLAQHHMVLGGNASEASWRDTANRFTVSTVYIPEAKRILKGGLAASSVVSGDEMLEYPIQNGWQSEHYDIVLVDECQDLNPQQIKLLSCIPTDRIVFVGDLNQAIYGFRGSDPRAISFLKEQYSTVSYPMNESFRCPIEVLTEVKHIVPKITSKKTGGRVYQVSKAHVQYPEECFITSRTNASLIKLAYRLIHDNEPFSISAKFVNSLKSRLNYVLKTSANIQIVRDSLLKQYNKEIAIFETKSWNATTMHDKYNGLFSIVNNCNTIGEVHAFIKRMTLHTNSSSPRKLLTIHGVKGLETSHVYFLDPDMCAYFKNKTRVKWEKQQEDNLYYVACTRALESLTFVR